MFGRTTGGGSLPELLGRHERQIRAYIRHRIDDQAAEDLYQDTVAEALEQAGRFRYQGDAQFLSWIYTIARRIAARARRRAERLRPMRICMSDSSTPGVRESWIRGLTRTPSSLAMGSERCRRLADAMNGLPEHYREVLILYRIEGRPLGEVARILNRSKTSTCHLLARAVARLSQALSE